MRRNRKKKGFTLVELIAVIAILGILAMIVVPKVGNYTGRAKEAKKLADAKTIAQAVEMYNTDTEKTEDQIIGTTEVNTMEDKLVPKYLSNWPKDAGDNWKTYNDILNEIGDKKTGTETGDTKTGE